MNSGFKKIDHELETKFTPVGSAKGTGKLERKKYGDGTERLKIKLRELDIPNGSLVEVRSGITTIAELKVDDGRARHDIKSPEHTIPKLKADTEVTVSYSGTIILKGALYVD